MDDLTTAFLKKIVKSTEEKKTILQLLRLEEIKK